MKKTYWNKNGTHQKIINDLYNKLPDYGPIEGKENCKLERFRKAANCYYDYYNNGLCNKAKLFSRIFKIPLREYGFKKGMYWNLLDAGLEKLEKNFDEIILEASKEQKLKGKSSTKNV